MKKTKLREPILYTSLWVMSAIITVIIFSSYIEDTWIMRLDIILWCVLAITFCYCLLWWIHVLVKRSDRNDTRDMKKYILWKIKDIDEKIEELREKKEELLLSIKD